MDYYAIGQRIRKNRKARGLSQEQLAGAIGISLTHMSHIETGNTKLSLQVMIRIANILQVRVDDLLSDTGPSDRVASVEEINRLLETCSVSQIRIIEDVISSLIVALKKNE